jgi:hypothetical protein
MQYFHHKGLWKLTKLDIYIGKWVIALTVLGHQLVLDFS